MNEIFRHLDHGSKSNNPTKIIVHAMGERILDNTIYDACDFLDEYKLSAHALVLPNGDIMRCRDDDEGAWHARGHNTDSLGIEFLVPGHHNYESFLEAIKTPYLTPRQYEAGVEYVRYWLAKHDIKEVRRHRDVSPSRKVDPGNGFPWIKFLADIGAGRG